MPNTTIDLALLELSEEADSTGVLCSIVVVVVVLSTLRDRSGNDTRRHHMHATGRSGAPSTRTLLMR